MVVDCVCCVFLVTSGTLGIQKVEGRIELRIEAVVEPAGRRKGVRLPQSLTGHKFLSPTSGRKTETRIKDRTRSEIVVVGEDRSESAAGPPWWWSPPGWLTNAPVVTVISHQD
jgi:hypothetical protein